MNTAKLVAIEVVIGLVLSIAASVGVLYAIGNDGTGPLIEGSSVFLLAMGIGIVLWIVGLIIARRITAARGPGARVLASVLVAVIAIVANGILLGIVLAFMGEEQLLFLFFLLPASLAFGIGALIANLLTHLVIARATPRTAAATP